MYEAMRKGFAQAAGVDPPKMKAVLLAISIACILLIAAWIGQKIMEAYGNGKLEQADVVYHLITLLITISAVIGFLVYL